MIKLIVSGWDLSAGMRKSLENALSESTSYSGVISVAVCSSHEVAQLNRDYAGIDSSTDVLSFSYVETTPPHDTESETALGDIAISREHIIEQAKKAGTDKATEFVLLLVHGSLHIFGFDHQDEDGRIEMDVCQRDIVEGLGLTYRHFGWVDE